MATSFISEDSMNAKADFVADTGTTPEPMSADISSSSADTTQPIAHKVRKITPSPQAAASDSSPDAPVVEDYHVHAGRLGGETTKQRHRDSDFYRQIGAMGGATTMARYGDQYEELRRRGGQTTRERYGEEYYHTIAAKAAKVKQDATRLRNEAILALLNDGWKIPTIIKLTLDDLPRLEKYLPGVLGAYLKERPQCDTSALFISQSGKPLSLANTYTVMERHKDAAS